MRRQAAGRALRAPRRACGSRAGGGRAAARGGGRPRGAARGRAAARAERAGGGAGGAGGASGRRRWGTGARGLKGRTLTGGKARPTTAQRGTILPPVHPAVTTFRRMNRRLGDIFENKKIRHIFLINRKKNSPLSMKERKGGAEAEQHTNSRCQALFGGIQPIPAHPLSCYRKVSLGLFTEPGPTTSA